MKRVLILSGSAQSYLVKENNLTKENISNNTKKISDVENNVKTNTKFIENHQSTKNGLLDWTFRTAIAIGIGYIAMKVGLK